MLSCSVCHAQGDSAEVSILGWEARKLSLSVAIQDYRQSPARNHSPVSKQLLPSLLFSMMSMVLWGTYSCRF